MERLQTNFPNKKKQANTLITEIVERPCLAWPARGSEILCLRIVNNKLNCLPALRWVWWLMTRDEISLIFQVETLSQSPASQEFQKQLSSELWQPLAQGQLTDINISAWQSKEKFPHPAVYFLYNPFLLRDCGSDLSYLLPPPTTYHQPHSSYFTLQEPLWSRRSLSWVVVCVCLSPRRAETPLHPTLRSISWLVLDSVLILCWQPALLNREGRNPIFCW